MDLKQKYTEDKEISFKKQFIKELIKEDAWISLTNEQRESVANIAEQQLQLYLVRNL